MRSNELHMFTEVMLLLHSIILHISRFLGKMLCFVQFKIYYPLSLVQML
jgi:hypothetical protein